MENEHVQQLRACVLRFEENLCDIAENSNAEFEKPAQQAESRHAKAFFTFSEVFDVVKKEPLVRAAVGPDNDGDELEGGMGHGSEGNRAGPSPHGSAKKIASDSMIVRTLNAASPRRAAAPSSRSISTERPHLRTSLLNNRQNHKQCRSRTVSKKKTDCCCIIS